ncbi:hypothetical protein N5K55_36575 [Pseudomonas aeruginosa]|nr:hypothetical protein [Pseudomonas aeruginosa]
MKQRNKDCCLNVKSENENFKRNVWIACVQNQVDFVQDLYIPSQKDYEIAIKNCFNEEAKQKLIEEYKSKFKEEEKEKKKIQIQIKTPIMGAFYNNSRSLGKSYILIY